MNTQNQMSAHELRDIIAFQLRELNKIDVSDKLAARKIDLAKQVFNGAGKMIALAAYVTEAKKMGAPSDVLSLPEKQNA